jgi:hypothetical protein
MTAESWTRSKTYSAESRFNHKDTNTRRNLRCASNLRQSIVFMRDNHSFSLSWCLCAFVVRPQR